MTLPELQVEDTAIEESYKTEDASSPKFTAPLVDTPKSVTVIPEAVMQDTAATSLQDVLRQVPGITFGAGEGGTAIADRPVIRGFSSTSTIFVDGLRDIGTQTRDIFALEAVEVVKGADSALSGRGSGGGSINLITKTAQADNFTRGTLQFGTDDARRITLDENYAFEDSTALRLNVMGARGDVPGRDSAVDYEKWGFAPSLAFGLGKPTRLTLDYYHYDEEGMPDYSIPYDPSTGEPVTESPLDVDSDNFYGLVDRDFRDNVADIGTIRLEHDFAGDMTLRNVARWGKSLNSYVVTNPDDSRGNVANGYVYRSPKSRWAETETVAEQLALSGTFDTGAFGHSYDVGAEYTHERRNADSWLVASDVTVPAELGTSQLCTNPDYGPLLEANGDCTSLYDPDPYVDWGGSVERAHNPTIYETETVGLYGFDTLALSDHWLMNLGLRWDHYDTETERPSDPTYRADSQDGSWNYQVGLVHKPVETASIYASWSTETTPAALGAGDEEAAAPDTCTARGCTPSNENLDPERSRTAEIGTKWNLFDERLALTFAVFETKRKNANVQVSDGIYEQVGESRVRGAEFTFSGNVTAAWQVYGGYSYLESELVEGGSGSLAVGEALPNTPENSFSAFTTYRVLPQFSVGGGAYYVDEVYGSLSSDPVKKVPSYWRYDATASYQATNNIELQLNVQNLTDEVYYAKAYANHYASLGPGRLFLLSTNFSF